MVYVKKEAFRILYLASVQFIFYLEQTLLAPLPLNQLSSEKNAKQKVVEPGAETLTLQRSALFSLQVFFMHVCEEIRAC